MLTDSERDQLIKDTHDNTVTMKATMEDALRRITVLERITNVAIGGFAIVAGIVVSAWDKIDKITWGS
jgi:hypothetical protein